MEMFPAVLWSCAVVLCFYPREAIAGSCKEAALCCTGRDSSCVVQNTPINVIDKDDNDKPCYCDHACLKLGDCCDDFRAACDVTDCSVSKWAAWSPCDVQCGTGTMFRERSVVRAPQHGGRHCPSLLQKRSCKGKNCHSQLDRNHSALRETNTQVPAPFSKSQHVNGSSGGMRQNERQQYETDRSKDNEGYNIIIEFEVTKSSKACNKKSPYIGLKTGDRICARCVVQDLTQPPQIRCEGQGLSGRSTQWELLAFPSCRGKWLRTSSSPISRHAPTCSSHKRPLFMFS